MQEIAPPDQRSRVMSFYAFSFMGAGPLGTLWSGYLAAIVGAQNAILLNGALMLIVTVLITILTRLWQAEFSPVQGSA